MSLRDRSSTKRSSVHQAIWSLVPLALASACGEVNGQPTDAPVPAIDGSVADARPSPDAIAPDATPIATRCDPTAPFGDPVAIDGVNTPDWEDEAFLSADELTMYFTSTRPGGVGSLDIWSITRASVDAEFTGEPTLVAGVNSAEGIERCPAVTADGLTMYASAGVGECGGAATTCNIGVATRQSTSESFSPFTSEPSLSTAAYDYDPHVLPDHSAIYFWSDRGPTPAMYRAARVGGAFQEPVVVVGTDLMTGDVGSPVVSPDELTIYFSSTRDSKTGGYSIYQARRASLAVGFEAPTRLAQLSVTDYVWPTWISADGCVLHFSSSLGGTHDLHYAVRGD